MKDLFYDQKKKKTCKRSCKKVYVAPCPPCPQRRGVGVAVAGDLPLMSENLLPGWYSGEGCTGGSLARFTNGKNRGSRITDKKIRFPESRK